MLGKTNVSSSGKSGGGLNKPPVRDILNCDYSTSTALSDDYGALRWTFNYNGSESSSFVLEPGNYKIYCYGSKGGKASHYGSSDTFTDTEGGNGGEVIGKLNLSSPITLYPVIGGTPFNGGGSGGTVSSSSYWTLYGGSGGGATHVSIVPGLLSTLEESFSENLLIVAGGGAGGNELRTWGVSGSYYYAHSGTIGVGGGVSGTDGGSSSQSPGGTGGANASGYAFGIGQNGTKSDGYCVAQGGAGGGFYGGSVSTNQYTEYKSKTANVYLGGSGGGSGYVNSNFMTELSMTSGANASTGKIIIDYILWEN